MKINIRDLTTALRAVELQTIKVSHLDLADIPLPNDQKERTHSACVSLIECLLVIIHDLEAAATES